MQAKAGCALNSCVGASASPNAQRRLDLTAAMEKMLLMVQRAAELRREDAPHLGILPEPLI